MQPGFESLDDIRQKFILYTQNSRMKGFSDYKNGGNLIQVMPIHQSLVEAGFLDLGSTASEITDRIKHAAQSKIVSYHSKHSFRMTVTSEDQKKIIKFILNDLDSKLEACLLELGLTLRSTFFWVRKNAPNVFDLAIVTFDGDVNKDILGERQIFLNLQFISREDQCQCALML